MLKIYTVKVSKDNSETDILHIKAASSNGALRLAFRKIKKDCSGIISIVGVKEIEK